MSISLPKREYVRVKVLSMGNMGVGKSCIIKRYCESKFVSRYISTIGVDFGVRPVQVTLANSSQTSPALPNTATVNVNFWDLSGDEQFKDIRADFYEDTQGAVLVYDVTNKQSFHDLNDWLKECSVNGGLPSVVAVAANKVDEPSRQVSEQDGRSWADARGFMYFETSCKNGDNVNELFSSLLCEIVTPLVRKQMQLELKNSS